MKKQPFPILRYVVALLAVLCLLPVGVWAEELSPARPASPAESVPSEAPSPQKEKEITLDFNNVDLPVFVRFISEITGKNFVIDETVRGKITVFSPSKIPVSGAFDLFLAVLNLKGLAVKTSGHVHQIVPVAQIPVERNIHVDVLEHTRASEVAKVLLGLISGAGQNPGQPPTQNRSTGEISDPVRILSDETTNALITTATDADYAILKKVLQQLDKRRRQVYVEAVVMEINLDKSKEIGTDIGAAFGYSNDGRVGGIGGINQNLAELPGLVELADKLAVPVNPFNLRAFLKALQTSSDVNILSTPQILTTDNQKAEIVVAENVPFPGAQSQTTGGNVQTTIERKDVGVSLRLTPSVLENNFVKLDLYQEVSSVLEGAQAVGTTVLGPKTSKRSATTSVIVAHAQTVVIGGLIQDKVISTEQKIPLLGDIPLIGWLFKTRRHRTEKTNLLIFLTPYIVHDTDDLDAIKSEKAGEAEAFVEEHRIKKQKEREQLLDELQTVPK